MVAKTVSVGNTGVHLINARRFVFGVMLLRE
jgi:hypothetical protein